MKKFYYLGLMVMLAGCQDDLVKEPGADGAVELTQIHATIASAGHVVQTRAEGDPTPAPRPVVYLEDAISRYKFVDKDEITFTSICRTISPIARFNYSDITFLSNSSGAWDRDKTTGADHDPSTGGAHPVRIYWSDATSEHTFVGFSTPNVKVLLADAAATFDWEAINHVYFGSIGTPTEHTMINYNPSTPESEEVTVTENGVEKKKPIPVSSLMRAEDLLLTYNTDIVAEASVANVKFYHGLSSVKVRVLLSEFYGSELDGYAIVDSMILKNQPTLYRWEQTDNKTAPKSVVHANNNPRDMFLWDYAPGGVGENAGKTFTFYGITVPQEQGYDFQDLQLDFRVQYPDPLKTDLADLKDKGTRPTHWLKKSYSAMIPKEALQVYFHPGQCTVINIKLNHKDETMTIGAQYTDWEFVPTLDEGSLKKNSTFLQSAPAYDVRPTAGRVTVANDPEANEDDATWLYYQKQNGDYVQGNDDGKVLLDIYGNTGTRQKPYTISTANQLLSLAYEVSNGGHSFEGKYIKLDAGIIMQKNSEATEVVWMGIGTSNHPFQGTFLGGGRTITRLKGAPLFYNVGAKALIDGVVVEGALTLSGGAALVERNAGTICACRAGGDIVSTGSGAVGALVGSNTGTIFACHHTGNVEGSGTVGGLVGNNTGSVLFSYHAGALTGTTTYGVSSSGGSLTDCYYDSRLAPAVTAVDGAVGKTTAELQKATFVDDAEPGPTTTASWNGRMQAWVAALPDDHPLKSHFALHSYTYQPAAYPRVQ